MLNRYWGAYWSKRGVRVNCVTPLGVLNKHEEAFTFRFRKMLPTERMMNVDKVIGAVIYLASDALSYTTSSNFRVDGWLDGLVMLLCG